MEYKEKKYNYVYKITNLINGKYYIGIHSTNNIRDGYRGSGKYLWNSYNKYGFENFIKEFLYFQKTRDEILKIEKEIVNREFIKLNSNMNIMEGGKAGFINEEQQYKRSQLGGLAFGERLKKDKDFREKMAVFSSNNLKLAHKAGKIKYNTFVGKKHKKETKDKIGKSNSISQKGNKNSNYGKIWIYNLELKEQKSIRKEDLDIWLYQGWLKGRKRLILGIKNKSNSNVSIFNKELNIVKKIKIEELQLWLDQGWKKGKRIQ